MPTCMFCRKSFKEPRGLTIFTFDGRSVHFCSSKCRKNHELGRDGRKTKWVIKRKGYKTSPAPTTEKNSE
jgi:ribosomal protein L24E